MDPPLPVHPDPGSVCEHCGLPVGSHPIGSGPYFCCSGCALVYETLQASGYGETYYRLKDLSEAGTTCPTPTSVNPLILAELDSPSFLEEHARIGADGAGMIDLFLDGVHCAACVWLVERLPYELQGVVEARLDLPRSLLTLRWRPDEIALSDVAQWLSRMGYAAHPSRQSHLSGRVRTERKLLIKLGICWALAGNVMLIAVAFYGGLDLTKDPTMAGAARLLSMILAVPAVWYGGSEFFNRAWGSFRSAFHAGSLKHLHMDVPISIGILVGFFHSTWATLSGNGEVWFDSITVLIAALLTARWLQIRSQRLAADATDRLLSLLPTMVRRICADGSVSMVRDREIETGDLVLVPAGEVVPVDGVLETGGSSLNAAVLTGESRPVPIGVGDPVEAGATNLSSPIRVRVKAVGAATRVGRLMHWVRDAEAGRAPVVQLADRLGGYFVLGVLGLTLLTAGIWLVLDPSELVAHVVALLVITCPCALGMATPLAMAMGSGRAARVGHFIKNSAAIENLAASDVVVLDKTGTLTEGRLSLIAMDGDQEAVRWAARLETESNHPLADALVKAIYPDEKLQVIVTKNEPGNGIRGWVDGHEIIIGRPEWVRSFCTEPYPETDRFDDYAQSGYTPVAVGVDGRLAAALGFGDRIRDEAPDFIHEMVRQKKRVHILSGDHPALVRQVGLAVGLAETDVLGGISPEEKRVFVEALQTEGHSVVMVGDGVNDAAALQAADVGIAVNDGSTASRVAADVFLTRPGLDPILDLIKRSERTMAVIRRNLGFSLVYNVLGAMGAMAGLVSPLVAAVAMPISSLMVVLSSIVPSGNT